MKKILSTMLVGALIAGAAFADISFDYTGSAILGSTTKSFSTANRNDCIALTLNNDIAGVHIDYDFADNKLGLDEYYGWITFGLPVGNLQITSGKWNSRFCNRVNNLAGDLDGEFYERYKPGVVYGGAQIEDGSNLTDGTMSTVLAYTLADTLPGVLMFKAGMVHVTTGDAKGKDTLGNLYYTPSDSEDLKFHAGFCFEASYSQEDLIKFNFAVKNTENIAKTSYGVYVSPLMIPNLNSLVGFTYLSADDDTAFGLDLRASYAVTEKTSLTGMINYTQCDVDGLDDPLKGMWFMGSLGYTAGENIRYVFTASNEVKDFDAKIGTANVFAISPACEVQASEKCNVTVGVDIRWTDVSPWKDHGTVRLPIYVSFSL